MRQTERRATGVLLATLLSVVATGCARDADPNLALACQIQTCVCRPENPPLFSPTRNAEVLWKDNGDAYCKPGYVLRRVDK